VTRFATRTFFRDPQSGLTYMVRFVAPTFTYDHSYFFEAYRAQYGRTYLEDFDHIVALGRERIGRIARHRSPQTTAPRLLDIGCAFGPFLYAAREAGWDVTGMDVSPEAVTHVQETLNIPAVSGSILDAATVGSLGGSYDIVTMWYVIEHVPQLAELLTTVRGLLRPGGIFAFATPYARGVSARRNLRAFLESSPEDHYTIFDRSSARATLAEFGFRVRAYHSTGHHPERFRPTPVPRALVAWWSRLAGRGDTFEVIAEAVK
jgi:2-polyprenyl-3-methyl-5-hydroxy-6-metoxy-1,4-benzoquinol methylase